LSKWYAGNGATIGFGLAIVVLIATGMLTYRNVETMARNDRQVVHTHEVLDQLRQILATVTQAETGQRGYVITGQDAYLEPYHRAMASIFVQLDDLITLTTDNVEQQRRAARLRPKVEARVISLGRAIELRNSGGFDASRAWILEGVGRQQMEEARELVAEMVATEEHLLDLRAKESEQSRQTAVSTSLLGTGVGLAMVIAAYTLSAREAATRQRMNAELEQRVLVRTAELAAANEALKISNRELEQFASVASHDLQEPLRKIEAFGDRLKTRSGSVLDESGRDYLERILGSAARMRSLISELLNFSRVTTRAQPPESISLERAAREVVSDLEGRVQQVNGRVDLGELPTIEADPMQIRQLLQNLIGNALKFHRPEVPPVVRVEGELLRNGAAGPQCRLTIKDNGIGFEEVYLDRIFDVFQRLHGRNEYEGTGMGLAICRKIVERHGGTITAQSEPGVGSTFIITLPMVQPKQE